MTDLMADIDALVVIGLQSDFCPGGSLPTPHGDEMLTIISALGRRFRHVALARDSHALGHRSLASSHSGQLPFTSIAPPYGPQVLWPDHCVQGERGAQFHVGLQQIPRAALTLRKGHRREIDSYSAFIENDRVTPTCLARYLRECGGLAFEFCLREDARRRGFDVVVVEDVCRNILRDG